jgi:hypothetical protein
MLLDKQDTINHEHRICNVMFEGKQMPAVAIRGIRAINSFFNCEQNMDTYTIIDSIDNQHADESIFYVCRRIDVQLLDIDRNSNIC